MKKIIIFLIFLLCLVIGYGFFSNQKNLSSKTNITPTQKICPNVISQDYYTYRNKDYIESGIKQFENVMASASAALNQAKNSNPKVKQNLVSYEEFKEGVKRLSPSADLEKNDDLVKRRYQEYLDEQETLWNKYIVNFNQIKQSNISNWELSVNMSNEIIKLHKTILNKL